MYKKDYSDEEMTQDFIATFTETIFLSDRLQETLI